MRASYSPADAQHPITTHHKRAARNLVALKALSSHLTALVTIAFFTFVFLATACASSDTVETTVNTAATTSACPHGVCVATVHTVAAPKDAIPRIDPTRAAILAEVRVEMTDIHMDRVVLLAIGDAASEAPVDWPHILADRGNYDRCLSQTWATLHSRTAPEAKPTDPDDEKPSDAAALRQCLEAGHGQWNSTDPAERSEWIHQLLETGWRVTAPSESARLYIHNEADDFGWNKLNTEYQACQQTTGPEADAVAAGPAEGAADRFLVSLGRTMQCNQTVTIQNLKPDTPGQNAQ